MTTSRYHPTARAYIFEGVLYFLEKGPIGIIISDACLAYVEYNLCHTLFACQSQSQTAVSALLGLAFWMLINPFLLFSIFLGYMTIASYFTKVDSNYPHPPNWSDEKSTNVRFVNKQLLIKYNQKRIPFETAIELYFDNEIDFIDIRKVFYNRYRLFRFVITLGHYRWFLATFLAQLLGHTQERDATEVGDVYNRGNDFYNWFLGPCMVYTSGIFHTAEIDEEALEDAQTRKLRTTLHSIHLKKGESLLDIGCGWGTLVILAAEEFGARATGCSIAKEQIKWARKSAEKHGVADSCSWIVDDYRNIPQHNNNEKYDKITCVEMAEHVGIKNFQAFLVQIHSMLKDDGMFYIQMCGVRRTWCFEDIVWIMFMGKYVFPGADASTPINWVLGQLERSGFELHRVENCGAHYARTIELWHRNWLKSESKVVDKYGVRWWRVWNVFLCWSYLIARQGTSAVYMMVCQKNMYTDQFSCADGPALNRTKAYIGKDVLGYQQ